MLTHDFNKKFYKTFYGQEPCDSFFDDEGNTVLMLACMHRRADVVAEILADPGRDRNPLNNFRMTPLMWACAIGDMEIAALLAADPKTRLDLLDWKGRSAEECAKMFGHHEVGVMIENAIRQRKKAATAPCAFGAFRING